MTPGRAGGSPSGEPIPKQSLSFRARQRLNFAAALLRSSGVVIDDARGFHGGVLYALDTLPSDERERVREQVDWVENYSTAETRFFGASARK